EIVEVDGSATSSCSQSTAAMSANRISGNQVKRLRRRPAARQPMPMPRKLASRMKFEKWASSRTYAGSQRISAVSRKRTRNDETKRAIAHDYVAVALGTWGWAGGWLQSSTLAGPDNQIGIVYRERDDLRPFTLEADAHLMRADGIEREVADVQDAAAERRADALDRRALRRRRHREVVARAIAEGVAAVELG